VKREHFHCLADFPDRPPHRPLSYSLATARTGMRARGETDRGEAHKSNRFEDPASQRRAGA
jgi:hypothetical protein